MVLQLLSKLSTAGLFQTDCKQANSLAQAPEDDWPPLGMAGHLDFYRDDSLQIHRAVGSCSVAACTLVEVLCWRLN